jgi:L-serine dehydratase
MSKLPPSIFNDVIGPVMRGPSSSHCAAALRIGLIARDLMDGIIEQVLVEFDTGGSLATTHLSHGSDMGLWGGLLGWDATCEELPQSARALSAAGIVAEVRVGAYGDPHPNTYRLTLRNAQEVHTLTAISTGGGMIEVIAIDDLSVSILGDRFETLLFLDANDAAGLAAISAHWPTEQVELKRNAARCMVQLSGGGPACRELAGLPGELSERLTIRTLNPVVPVLTGSDMALPFLSCREMLDYNLSAALPLWALAARYESARGGISDAEVFEQMRGIARVMRGAIDKGVAGTNYDDRILGWQSGSFRKLMEQGTLLDGGMLNAIILAVTATMECKSAMGLVVAAPTAGSCGVLPGACLAAADFMGKDEDDAVKALLAAGMIGVFIAEHATFSAEVGGCQAECGSASGMAAAGLVTLAGGTVEQAISAASMALQASFGMVCDPIANRVEAPCLGKNVLAAANALSAANMGLANFDALIPLDEVVAAMDQVGKSLPHELRCTALGGLSLTDTSRAIEDRLRHQ